MNVIMKKLIPRSLPMFIPSFIVAYLLQNRIIDEGYYLLFPVLLLGAAFVGHMYWRKLAQDYITGRLK